MFSTCLRGELRHRRKQPVVVAAGLGVATALVMVGSSVASVGGSRSGLVLSTVVVAGAFGLATLVTASGVDRRGPELGVLRAIGWSRGRVGRQVAAEAVAQAVVGGGVGVALGVVMVLALGHGRIPGRLAAADVGLAILGGLLAGVVGGVRAARVRPAEALGEDTLIAALTAQENVETALAPLPIDAATRAGRAQAALAAVGLSEQADRLPRDLSPDERRRVVAARTQVRSVVPR